MSEKKKQHGAGQLLPLFVSFLKIGAFTFGGGYAMIPLIQKEAADRHKWMTDEEIMEIVALPKARRDLSRSTPRHSQDTMPREFPARFWLPSG